MSKKYIPKVGRTRDNRWGVGKWHDANGVDSACSWSPLIEIKPLSELTEDDLKTHPRCKLCLRGIRK